LFWAKKQQTGCLFRAKKILEHIKPATVRTGPLKPKKLLQPIFIETIRATASCSAASWDSNLMYVYDLKIIFSICWLFLGFFGMQLAVYKLLAYFIYTSLKASNPKPWDTLSAVEERDW
jgi:hypothetical protein